MYYLLRTSLTQSDKRFPFSVIEYSAWQSEELRQGEENPTVCLPMRING